MTGRETLLLAAQNLMDRPVPDHCDACLAMLAQVAVAMVQTSPSDEAPRMAALSRLMATWER